MLSKNDVAGLASVSGKVKCLQCQFPNFKKYCVFRNIYQFTQLKARMSRQNDLTIDGRMGKFDMTNVSLPYLPTGLMRKIHVLLNLDCMAAVFINFCQAGHLPGNLPGVVSEIAVLSVADPGGATGAPKGTDSFVLTYKFYET